MTSIFGFKNYYYPKYKLLLILRFKGAANRSIPVLTSMERKDFFYLRDQLNKLKDEGFINIADRFHLDTLPNSLQLPDMVVSLTTKGVEETNRYIVLITSVLASIATIIGVIFGFFKS